MDGRAVWFFCEASVSICVGPRRSPPALCVGPGSLCVGFRHSLALCGPGALCVGARRSPWCSLCRALALSVSGRGGLCVGPRHSLCRPRHTLALCVGLRRSLAVCVGFRARSSEACSSACHPFNLRQRSACLWSACLRASLLARGSLWTTFTCPFPGSTAPIPTPSSDPCCGRPPLIRCCGPPLRAACHQSRPSSDPRAVQPAAIRSVAPQLRSACHPSHPRAPGSDPRATHPARRVPFAGREPQTLLFGGIFPARIMIMCVSPRSVQ